MAWAIEKPAKIPLVTRPMDAQVAHVRCTCTMDGCTKVRCPTTSAAAMPVR
ncbi:MAG: hypothetical protein ACE5HF_09510 [Gemmatimonadota bacterium]